MGLHFKGETMPAGGASLGCADGPRRLLRPQVRAMKVKYFKETDASLLVFSSAEVKEARELTTGPRNVRRPPRDRATNSARARTCRAAAGARRRHAGTAGWYRGTGRRPWGLLDRGARPRFDERLARHWASGSDSTLVHSGPILQSRHPLPPTRDVVVANADWLTGQYWGLGT
jgi:hypothetical protein